MFSVHLQSSLLIFCKTECIFFPYLHLQQRPGGEAPIFNLQHSISIAFFFSFSFALKHFSTAILLSLWAKKLNTLTSKNTRWLVVQKLSALIWGQASYFCLFPVGDLHIDFMKNCFLSHIDAYFIQELWSYISYFIVS